MPLLWEQLKMLGRFFGALYSGRGMDSREHERLERLVREKFPDRYDQIMEKLDVCSGDRAEQLKFAIVILSDDFETEIDKRLYWVKLSDKRTREIIQEAKDREKARRTVSQLKPYIKNRFPLDHAEVATLLSAGPYSEQVIRAILELSDDDIVNLRKLMWSAPTDFRDEPDFVKLAESHRRNKRKRT